MIKQPLPIWLSSLLVYLLPPLELFTAGFLLFKKTNALGLWLSAVLLTGFTTYVGLATLHAFQHVPCACGGVIAGMNWREHFVFNVFFLSLNLIALYISAFHERRFSSK